MSVATREHYLESARILEAQNTPDSAREANRLKALAMYMRPEPADHAKAIADLKVRIAAAEAEGDFTTAGALKSEWAVLLRGGV
jgi:hypothetical protein